MIDGITNSNQGIYLIESCIYTYFCCLEAHVLCICFFCFRPIHHSRRKKCSYPSRYINILHTSVIVCIIGLSDLRMYRRLTEASRLPTCIFNTGSGGVAVYPSEMASSAFFNASLLICLVECQHRRGLHLPAALEDLYHLILIACVLFYSISLVDIESRPLCSSKLANIKLLCSLPSGCKVPLKPTVKPPARMHSWSSCQYKLSDCLRLRNKDLLANTDRLSPVD